MKRTNLRRAVSGVLSVAMTASALFSDFTVPTNVFASEDTSVSSESSLDVYSDGSGSITSGYIAANLDEDLGSEAAALNKDAAYTVAEEYLLSTVSSNDVESVSDTDDTETDDVEDSADVEVTDANTIVLESAADTVSTSGNDADSVGVSSNDVGVVTLTLDDTDTAEETEVADTDEADVSDTEEIESSEEVTVSEEEVAALAEEILENAADIETVDDYDTNGLATVYHYILLNVTLVDSDYVWDGMTITDIWSEVPESFIASYLTTINVYTLEDNEDYYVALVDPAALNGLGSATYADFTDLNTEDPTVYNDLITYDADTGLIYIPKSFYYDENGEEVSKELEAQVLVPYSMDQEESSLSVSVESEIDGVEGISGTYSVPTLDVTTTFQIVSAEDADKISLDDICVSVNDDVLPFDTSDGNALYDTETGELTISASPNTVYSINVVISEGISETDETDESDETLAFLEQREILVASASDDLSGILVADSSTSYSYANEATTVAGMNTLLNTTVTLDSGTGTLKAGQTFNYSGHWATIYSGESAVVYDVIANTAIYSYYAWDSGTMENVYGSHHATYIDDSNYSDIIFSSSGSISYSSTGTIKHLYVAASGSNYHYAYNRMVSLPNNQQLVSTDGGASISWTSACYNGTYSGSYSNYVAVHCTEAVTGNYAGSQSSTSNITMRVLYVSSDYMVFSISLPTSYTQAGSAVYKVPLSGNKNYYARFGIDKVDSVTGDTLSGATFAYKVSNTFDYDLVTDYVKATERTALAYESGSTTATSLTSALKTNGFSITDTISTYGRTYVSLNDENSDILADYGSQGYIWVYITEVVAPESYERQTGLWALQVSVSTTSVGNSTITQARFYDCTYASDKVTITSTSTPTYYSSYAYFEVPNDEIDYYGAMDLRKVNPNGEYVGGAVYALIDYGSVNDFTSYAATANATGSASAAIKSFYTSLSNAGYASRLEGVYTTSSSGAVHLKSVTSSGTVSSTNKVLDFDTQQQAYVLVEIYSPSGYGLDTSYYAFVLDANYNTSSSYTTAANNTTFEGWLHEGDQVEEIVNEDSLTAKLIMEVEDTPNNYYAAIDLLKVSSESSSTYVGGAVYAIIEKTDAIDYEEYIELAEDAASGTSAASIIKFYKLITDNYNAASSVVGFYTTNSDSTAATLKSYNANSAYNLNTLSTTSTDFVFDLGTETSKDYVIVEIYSPSTYILDDDYVAFTLNSHSNTSDDRDTALKASTLTWIHQSDSVSVSGNTSGTTTTLKLTFEEDEKKATYYAAIEMAKVDSSSGDYVGGAIYALVQKTSNFTYAQCLAAAQSAFSNASTSDEAMINFYQTMGNSYSSAMAIMGTFTTSDDGAVSWDYRYAIEMANGTVDNDWVGLKQVINFGENTYQDYCIVEIWSPTGYLQDEDYHSFRLRANGNTSNDYDTALEKSTITWLHQGSNASVSGNTSNTSTDLVLTFADDEETYRTQFFIQKVDENGDNLNVSGIVFTVYSDAACKTVKTTATTNSSGKATLSFKTNGSAQETYYVKETFIPPTYSGLTINEKIYEVTVTPALVASNSTISVKVDGKSVSTTSSTFGYTFNIANDHETYYGEFAVRKIDDAGNVVKTAGIKFNVYSDSSLDTLVTTIQTNANGIATYTLDEWKLLTDGSNKTQTFYVTEVASSVPAGYEASDDTLTIKVTGSDVGASSSTITATSTSGETLNVSGFQVDFPNKKVMDYTVEKTFDDDTEAGDRITKVIVTLYRQISGGSKTKVATKTLNASNNWTYTWTDLPVYDDDGNAYDYSSAETSVTFTNMNNKSQTTTDSTVISKLFEPVTVENSDGTKTTIQNGFPTKTVSVKKTFGTGTSSRITSVELTLSKNGTDIDTIELSSSNNWAGAFESLDVYTLSGTTLTTNTYTVRETAVTYVDMWGVSHKVADETIINKLFTVTYTTTSGDTITVNNTYDTTTHTVKKTLGSDTTTDVVNSVTMRLTANDASLTSIFGNKTLNNDNSWTATWTGLDIYDYKGNLISYEAEEVSVNVADQLYTTTINTVKESNLNTVFTITTTTKDGTTTVDNTIITRPVNVQKTFGDEDTEDRVQWVIVELLRNGVETGKTLTLSDSNNWYDTFENLVKYDSDGNEYKYTVQEKYVNYNDMWGTNHTVSGSVMTTLFTTTQSTSGETVTIKNTFNFAEYTVTKTLDTDLTESLVTSITAELYADGVKFDSVVLSDSNSWTNSTWKGTLDKYDYQGNLITYSADEVSVRMKDQMHTATVNSVPKSAVKTVFDVKINLLDGEAQIGDTVVTTELKVEKKFGNNDTEDRTNMVVVMLYRNDEMTGRTLTLNEANNWTNTFTDLVKYDPNGVEYEYRAVEYVIRYRDMWGDYHNISDSTIMNTLFVIKTVTKDGVTTITNTFNTVDYSVSKTLGSDLTEQLVESVTMELYADGRTYDSVVLSDTNSWKNLAWRGTLDEYDYTGKLITYTSKEVNIQMEDQFDATVVYSVTSAIETVFDVVIDTDDYANQIDNTVVTIDVDVEKVFANDKTKDRISEVVVTLYRNDEAKPYTITLNDSNDWKGTFEKLVKYDPDGVEYEYRAVETSVTYTDMWGDTYTVESRKAIENLFAVEEVTANYKTTVTNTFQFTERNVMKLFATKITSDRLVQITARIYADGRDASSLFGDRILNAATNWIEIWDGYNSKNVWVGLDKYDHNGNLIDYTTKEIQAIYTDKDSPVETQHIVSGGTLITIFEPVYDNEVDETTSSITNELQTVDLKVVKTWGDYTESHLVSIDVELWENNNPTGKIVTLSRDNDWTYTWEELDKYDSIARAYKYEAKEISVTYTDMWGDEYTVTPDDLMFVLFDVETETEDGVTTIKNTYATTEYTVNKTFGTTLTESLVESIEAMLVADGRDAEIAFANLTLTADGSWTGTWYGIDKYDHEGNEVVYTAKEVSVDMTDQFDATAISTVKSALNTVFTVITTIGDGETTVDNTVVTTEHTVVKKFGENTDGRITEVEVTLYRNGKEVPATLTLNESKGWTDTFTDLVKYDPEGNEYEYSAVETKVIYNDMWGESHTITDETIINTVFDVDAETADDTTTITNTIVVTEHNVVKTFGSELTESLVESIVAELFANKVSLETVFGNRTLTKATDWSATWEKLDKYDYTGTLYDYTSEEVSVDMEDQFDANVVSTVKDALHTVFTVITSTKNGTTTVDNTVNITHLDVEKVFGDKTEQRVKEVVVTLYRNGEAKPYTLTLNADNNWSDTFEKLVKYDPDGNEYVYTAVETSVTYYDMWGDAYTVTDPDVMDKLFNVEVETSDNKTTITNTFEYTTRAVIKNFATLITANRMVQVTTTLYADNVSTKSLFGDKTLSADNAWADIWDGYDAKGTTWIGLDKYDHNGNLITYTVRETTASYLDKNFHSGTVHTVIGDVLVTLFEPVYNDEVDETTSEVTNHFQTTDITVEKKFGEGTEGRVTSVIVELYENGKATGCTVTLDDTNDWTYTWKELDKFDSTGVTYDYTVKEISVTYTDMWGDSYTITDEKLMKTIFDIDVETTPTKTVITNTLRQTEYTVSKTFGSELTEDLVKNIVAELFADGNSLEGVFGNKTLDADNSWTDTWTGLDKFDHEGNRIVYTAAEVSADVEDQFDATVISTVKDALETVFDVITTTKRGETSVDNTIVTTELDVEKTFGDNTENRISEVEVTLYRNGEAVDYVRTLNADNSWSYTFTDLVMYDPDGVAYEYEAVETGVTYTDMWGNEYTVTDADVLDKLFNVQAVTEDGKTTITNTFEYTERAVTKSFATDLAEKRIQAITTTLYADSASLETVFGDITLNADNSWTSLWTGLDKYDYEGNKIVYTVRETTATYLDMDGIEYTVSDNALVIIFTPEVNDEVDETSSEITNDFSATEHTVIKTFGDVVSEDRVINVVAELYRNGEETGRTVVLSEENDWTYTWTELDMYDSTGEAYEYTAVEVSVTYMDVRGDEQTITGEMLEKIFNSEEETLDKVTLLTNTLETVEHEVVKVFMEDTTAKDDVEFVTVQLYADGVAVGSEITLNDANEWTYTWADLDAYNADGTDVVYTVKEILINGTTTPTADNGYIVTYDDSETTVTTITNDTTKLEISKTDIVTTEEVEGAKLTIYSVDENGERTEYTSWTSTKEPHYIEKIPTGNYVLVEEYAPGSYVTAQEVEFTVEATGEIQIVEMIDDFTKVEISKTDLVDGEEVIGATLTLYEVDEEGNRTFVDTWETNGEPHTIERLDKGTYVLVEENTPDGYQVAEEVVFEVIDTDQIQKIEMKDARTYGKVGVERAGRRRELGEG